MPGYPVAACETTYSIGTDQPSHRDASVHLSAEEELAAEESLSIYCKPVEFYNILQRRAIRNPSFLQKCLDYQIKAKNKKRIKMTVSLSWSVDETQTVFPLHICLARLNPNNKDAESSGIDGNTLVRANFTLPEVKKLAVEARADSIAILFFTTVENPNSSSGVNASLVPLDLTSYESRVGKYCLCGKVSLQSLYMAWDSSPNFRLGQRAEIMSTVDLLPCILKYEFLNKGGSVSVQDLCNSENVSTSKQVQITISAEEFGAKDKSPYHTHASSEVSSSSLSRIMRLKEGNVMFNYRYYNNKLQRTEVVEDFCCPFCLVKCASYKGLRYHLFSSHDLFNFEFSASEDCQVVNVSVKTDNWRSEIVADGVDPKVQTFIYCAKPLKRRSSENESSENVKDAESLLLESEIPADPLLLETEIPSEPLLLESEIPADPLLLESENPAGETELLEKADGVSNAIIQSNPDPDCVPPISEHDHGTSAVRRVAKRGKLQVEHSDSRNTDLLRKRQFYHSRKVQPIALQDVLSGEDSENEIDEEVAGIEERRMLGNFIDLNDDEKRLMHIWNSFTRRQGVLADGHVPWAYEAFTKLHIVELVKSTSFAWHWRLFMIKLYNHGLLDARTMNECSIIYQDHYNAAKSDRNRQNSDPNRQNPDPNRQNPDPNRQNPDPNMQNPDPNRQNSDPNRQNPDPNRQDPDSNMQNSDPNMQNPDSNMQNSDPNS
ncbi:polycomb group protein EMBRYONIC FLOWER 2-like isoform X2 [Gastrolobium bilobum]|uniref:polycomb group protein EMBRYONIC FLOWER 2-like isoform X2 n=1 Tax=Gastrolobium bilobum TaxID=150636 RepID=UPI002AB0F2FC|nr:polycomb group protein EMBRYONIC FLOWER 2-like isoform X2 [Gastrolobium bilobum]